MPIVDHVLKNQPERHSVRALVVYPMNALINSQLEALETFRKERWPECPVRFAHYTGQVRDEARNAIIDDPPHILLTNYVMLEYMLIRPAERTLIGLTTRELAFLVMDELHFYRGRQGADVSMLLRRVRQRAGRRDPVCIGTSATIVTDGDAAERRRRIAEAGRKLFGVEVPPDHVIEETLQRVADGADTGGPRGARRSRPRRAAGSGARSGEETSARCLGGGDLRPRGPGRAAGAPYAACIRGGRAASGRGDRA